MWITQLKGANHQLQRNQFESWKFCQEEVSFLLSKLLSNKIPNSWIHIAKGVSVQLYILTNLILSSFSCLIRLETEQNHKESSLKSLCNLNTMVNRKVWTTYMEEAALIISSITREEEGNYAREQQSTNANEITKSSLFTFQLFAFIYILTAIN